MANDPVDVLIVGSGASGGAFAWSMADTRMRILCLEQGDWVNSGTFPTSGKDWERRTMGDMSPNPNVRNKTEDYPVNDSNSPVTIANYNAVGGSTIAWAAHFPRMHPSDFRVRSLDGVADDWPVNYAQLEPYFAENDRMMGIAGLAGDPAYPPHEMQMPPLPLGKSGEKLARAFNDLGWHWWPSDSAIATEVYEGRDQCLNLGPCTSGCTQGAKASTNLTYWPEAIRRGVQIKTRCRVREVTLNESGFANGVIYYDENGIEQFQPAEVVVLACNGIGTPRLMLNSVSGRFPNGIANSSDMVGRNLMFHPYASIMGTFDERLDGQFGPAGCCIWSQEFYETQPDQDYVRGYTFEIVRGRGPLVTALSGLGSGDIPWGQDFHTAFGERFAHSAGMLAICEDLPELHNRVTLDPELKDSDGIPAPRIDYQLSDNSQRMMRHAIDRATEVLNIAGATGIQVEAPWRPAGWHNMGTARMGDDPSSSVVNAWGRSHDVRNLFVIDGSLFVTSGGMNPTSTIQALALYIADTMKKNLANLFD
jgi:choline dehydrogenase-like flavoprotein